MKWIKSSERLPEAHERVIGYDLFYDRIGECQLSSWCKDLEFVDSQKDDCFIILWQPKPKSPGKRLINECKKEYENGR